MNMDDGGHSVPRKLRTAITSLNRLRAPLRWNCTNGSPASAFKRIPLCFASGCDRGRRDAEFIRVDVFFLEFGSMIRRQFSRKPEVAGEIPKPCCVQAV